MIRLNWLFRSSSVLLRSQVRLLHVGDANVLHSEVDKQSAEYKVHINRLYLCLHTS